MFKTNQLKETMKKEIITILKTAINLIEEKNDLDFVLFFINKSFKAFKNCLVLFRSITRREKTSDVYKWIPTL